MERQLDLTGFEASGNEIRASGREIELCVENIGGRLFKTWPTNIEKQRQAELSAIQTLRAAVRLQLGIPNKDVRSIALVDWTSLNRACDLVEGDHENSDPFVALADFSVIVTALLFYDRVVVLDNRELAKRANQTFGLDQIIYPIYPGESQSPTITMAHLLDSHYQWAWHHFNDATEDGSKWIKWLKANWKALLPDVVFPQHRSRNFDREMGYNTSPKRQSWLDVLFKVVRDEWQLSPASSKELILDNDLRALIYERLAQTLEAMGSDEGQDRSIRYIGGCLRTPVMLARDKYARECLKEQTTLESWLESEWAKLYRAQSLSVRLPFWTGSLLSRVKDRKDLPEEINSIRSQAIKLRVRKAELEGALREGRVNETKPLLKALQGDTAALTEWLQKGSDFAAEGLAAGGKALLKTCAPAVPTEIIDPAKKAASLMGGSEWLRKLSLKLFRPHVHFVLTIAADDRSLRDSVVKAARIFNLGGKVATEPLGFLERLGRISSIA